MFEADGGQPRREHVLAYREFLIVTNRSTGDLLAMWHYARGAGLLVGEPEELRAIILAQPMTPTQLVDRYGIKAPTVRKVNGARVGEVVGDGEEVAQRGVEPVEVPGEPVAEEGQHLAEFDRVGGARP